MTFFFSDFDGAVCNLVFFKFYSVQNKACLRVLFQMKGEHFRICMRTIPCGRKFTKLFEDVKSQHKSSVKDPWNEYGFMAMSRKLKKYENYLLIK